MIMIRVIRESDAEEFLNLCKRIDAETFFMMFEPDERSTTVQEQRSEIQDVLSRDNQIIFLAEKDGQLIGYLTAYGGRYKRNRHNVYIVAGVLQAFTARGVGTRLILELEKWAFKNKIHRLELTVMAQNEPAITLYRKMGFEIEGRKRHALFIGGSYVDEYCMAKLLL